MSVLRNMILMVCVAATWQAVVAQTPAPKHVAPADAKSHPGEDAIVCGAVADVQIPRNGLAGKGLPAQYYLDGPSANPVFYFIDFVPGPESRNQSKPDYNGKRICVTGKISLSPAGVPFILALKHSQVKPEAPPK